MSFHKTRNVFTVIIVVQIVFALSFLLLIDVPSGFSELDVKNYNRSRVILDSKGKVMSVSLSESEEWCVPVSLDKTGKWAKRVTVALEDKRFNNHHGIDILAIVRALVSNVRSGHIVSGASTITSQLARISKPQERKFYNKILEFWNAYKLEDLLAKDEILELYLNRAPFGGNVRGIEAASNAYFNKSADSLSLGETITLISMLRSPSKLRPDRFPERAFEERNRKLSYLAEKEVISSFDMNLARLDELPGQRYSLPHNAAMAVAHIKKESEEKSVVSSTIDAELQLLLEKNISDALADFPTMISGAGIIVENSTGFVRAYVGNALHGKALPNAQVDCGDALRSPGSTLKSFIYAAAFEQGLLTPASLLADTPLAFMGSAPRNFDMSYRGPVSVRNALANSLNAPAVRTLRMVGYNNAKIILNRFGFSNINKDPLYYTDALVLGGCEVSLIQLATAYRAIAMNGKYSRLRWTPDAEKRESEVLSPEAAYLVTSILRDERRLLPIYQEITNEKNMTVAFKTGTSYGLRDAWTAGYSNSYTVVIWIGSPSGEGNSRLVGMETAAPVFLKIMREIWTENERPFIMPSGVEVRRVCSLSGNLPNRYCAQTVTDLFMPGISNTTLCALHRNIDGMPMIIWPPELRNWMQTQERVTPVKTVKIIRPANGNIIILQNNTQTERIFLSAEGDFPQYWYLDSEFIGICEDARGLFADVAPGEHKASVLSGNASDTVTFEVKTPKALRDSYYHWDGNIIN